MTSVVGLDEVGRGSWAGPLVAGAVILDKRIRGLKDSKLLTRQEREKLDARIRSSAISFGLGWVTHLEIDKFGLTKAVSLAMQRALDQVKAEYSQIIIDGNYNFLAHLPGSTVQIGADNLVPSVSAASIIAKVARDNYMMAISAKYPDYLFESNVGYGTRYHIEAIEKNGICEIHRRLFRPIWQVQQQLL